MKQLLAAIIFIGFSVLAMCVSILFRKNGKFPQSDIGANEQLKDKGLSCMKDDNDKVFGDKQHNGLCAGDLSDSCKDCGFFEVEKKIKGIK